MAKNTKIEWTNTTWNPVTGCTKISPGCMNCYAERMANRLFLMGSKRYRNGFKATLHDEVVEAPLKWKKPQMIFVNSMSDLFLRDVPFSFIKDGTTWGTFVLRVHCGGMTTLGTFVLRVLCGGEDQRLVSLHATSNRFCEM